MADLVFPVSDPPAPGEWRDLRPGLRWLRMPLAGSLNHINLWLIADGAGWTLVDTGMRTAAIRDAWLNVFQHGLDGKPITRVMVTHYHPDHIGEAGWLCGHWDAPLWMTRTDFLYARMLILDAADEMPGETLRFFTRAGASDDMLAALKAMGLKSFAQMADLPPRGFHRIRQGDRFAIGQHQWQVVIGRGHAPEHACFWCPEEKLLISGDQVLPSISSNVSVYPTEPDGDPLRDWLDSLAELKQTLPADLMVLPAHGNVFTGLHDRLQALIDRHHEQLRDLLAFCGQPRTAVDAFPVLFNREIRTGDFFPAIGEALAHMHYLAGQGLLRSTVRDGVCYFEQTGD